MATGETIEQVNPAWCQLEMSSRNRAESSKDKTESGGQIAPILVDFEENDPENPLNWPYLRKVTILIAASSMTMISVFATTTIVPAAPQVLEDFHVSSALYRTLLVTIWELGEGVGPFVVAPLSERYGRVPVYHIGNLLGLGCAVASALSVNISMLIAFRFLNGAVLPTLTLAPAIAADLFPHEEHGVAVTIAMGCQLLGEFISPVTGSYAAQALGWRWTAWLAAIMLGAFGLLSLALLRETYAVKILERKAARLAKESGDRRLRSKYQARVDATTIIENATKPMQILFGSPTVLLISVYTAVTYGLISLLFSTLTEVMESTYSISRGAVGLTFLSLAIGNLLAMPIYSFTSDRYIKYKKKTKGDAFRPESRLMHLLLAAVSLPLGFLLYGWTLASHVQYIVPLIGTCAAGLAMVLSILPTETYLVDVYDIHGASAIAAGVILRAILGAVLPLAGPPLYRSVGLGWGNSALALIAAIFIPPLGLLMRYGDWFRRKEHLDTLEAPHGAPAAERGETDSE